jgi:hypothetical protein
MDKTITGNWAGVIFSPINISYEQTQCIGAWGNYNYIVNGDFEQNKCPNDCCVWSDKSGDDLVYGWIPNPEIEVGRGYFYNKILGNSWVSELDALKNTCIKQKIILNTGLYLLTYDAIAKAGIVLESNKFEVKLDGIVVKKF